MKGGGEGERVKLTSPEKTTFKKTILTRVNLYTLTYSLKLVFIFYRQ